ncbi:MAG: hypothetical protein KDA20_02625 [Phycisphaerales bacterium]|nr:hypothetical protein [Phycisphaerales bacterium]
MHFCLVDRVLEHTPGRIVTLKNVSAAEEYLQDHFPTFPVLPGVFMLEACVQAARTLIDLDAQAASQPIPPRYVLAAAKALKYGNFVAPGHALRIEITAAGDPHAPERAFKALGTLINPADPNADTPTCVSGRLTLRPLRIPPS